MIENQQHTKDSLLILLIEFARIERSTSQIKAHSLFQKTTMSAPSPSSSSPSDSLTSEQQGFIDAVLRGKSLFLRGKAGVGKSRTFRAMGEALTREKIPFAYTASTGIAATNIGGCTLHSFFGIGKGDDPIEKLIHKISSQARGRILNTQVVPIDEVSMISAELWEKIDAVCRFVRHDDHPFGGIQIVCSGDFAQLSPPFAPIFKDGKREKGDTRLIFESPLWREMFPKENQVELTTVFRQKEPEFIAFLNEFRTGKISDEGFDTIAKCSRKLTVRDGIEPTMLYSKRVDVHRENENRLYALPGGVNCWTSSATDVLCAGLTKEHLDKQLQAPDMLKLKVGAQVMLLINKTEMGLSNGSRGVVTSLANKDQVTVRFLNTTQSFPRHTFEVKSPEDSSQVATRQQYPFILSWACTIHKSQGMTIDYLIADLSDCFAAGQAYVAVSRATSTDGLEIRGYSPSRVRADRRVLAYDENLVSDTEVLEWAAAERGKTVEDLRCEFRASKRRKV